jgi:hypothetical protein
MAGGDCRTSGGISGAKPRTMAMAVTLLLLLAGVSAASERRTVVAGGNAFSATVVRFPLTRFRLGVALAGRRVGDNAFLLDIARAAGARCAINGTFFAAYPGETGEPYGTLVVDGKLLHLGGVGTRLDILADGSARIVRDRLEIRGTLNGSDIYPYNWYAYNLNQTPPPVGSSAYIYTPERGAALGFRAHLAIIARAGRIVRITRGEDAAIPADGFVIALQGKEVEILGWKFHIDQRIDYRALQGRTPLRSRFSLGAGPRLVRQGVVSVDPIGEGFRDPKIVSLRGTRSAVGLTGSEVILAVVERATITDAALAMQELGAVEAMNLDDNASSALVCNGQYLVRPGRKVANALVLWPALR